MIGSDDIEIAEYLNLTTIRQPLHESGLLGSGLLLDALENDSDEIQKITLKTEVVPRGTTASPGA